MEIGHFSLQDDCGWRLLKASFVNKLHQRGHLVTLYQDIERIMEIEKENNKIESVIKNAKTNWKDCFHLFKTNFIMICQTVIEDLYDNMIK